jgi:uncharacterized membrane-anchored protein
MLQAAIAGLILIGIYKFLDRNRIPEDFDPKVNWWMAGVFVFAPSMLIFLLVIALGIIGLPPEMSLLGYALYFLIPFIMLKHMLDFKVKRALIFSAFVPVIAVSTEVIFFVLLQAPNA